MRPLEGVVVVALEQVVSAPYASRQLADLGARVIKIERPNGGDFARGYDKTVLGQSSYFVWCNRSKESVVVDLKSEDGLDTLTSLIGAADVFLHNLAPGAIERLGFGSQRLTEKYPRLIICQISGYGSGGPYRDRKAYDLLIQCEAGLVSITGSEDSPARVGISVADVAAGMYAFSGILTALLVRERTGAGSVIEVSMLEALGEWMGAPAYFTSYGGSEQVRSGDRHPYIAPYGSFASQDGSRIYFAVQNDHDWAVFCESVIEAPDLVGDPRFKTNVDRVARVAELEQLISSILGQLTADEIEQRLAAAGIANAHLNTVKEFLDHPQLHARERYRSVETPSGPVWAMIPPTTISGVEAVMGPVPDIGQHTEQVLRELRERSGHDGPVAEENTVMEKAENND